MKLPRVGLNFYKVLIGVAFSLLWAKVMYVIWQQPSYITFVWFYLGLGSILVKWVFFEIIDRVHKRARLKAVEKQLAQSETRVQQVRKDVDQEGSRKATLNNIANAVSDKRLKDIEEDVLSLAKVIEKALERSLKSLGCGDLAIARQIIQDDTEVDDTEFVIREECMRAMSAAPLGTADLRMVVAMLGIITELERMGDYAEGIANITLMIGEGPPLDLPASIPRMAEQALRMLQGSMQSFQESDVDRAKSICRLDDEVDALYDQTFHTFVLQMIQQPKLIAPLTRLVWVAHNLERFADRVTNICEWIVFGVSGKRGDIGASKY